MRARPPWRSTAAVAALVASAVVIAACGGGDDSSGTLAPIEGAPGDTGGTTATTPAPSTTTAPVEGAGVPAVEGFVSVTVQVASVGIDETLALDRASVPAAQLDPLNLDASCSALDGGDPLALSIIDLRRLAAGSRLVSATLRTEDPATEPGEHPAQLEVADAEQLTTTYDVTVLVDDGGRSGTFQGDDGAGNVANGSWVCADQPSGAPETTS